MKNTERKQISYRNPAMGDPSRLKMPISQKPRSGARIEQILGIFSNVPKIVHQISSGNLSDFPEMCQIEQKMSSFCLDLGHLCPKLAQNERYWAQKACIQVEKNLSDCPKWSSIFNNSGYNSHNLAHFMKRKHTKGIYFSRPLCGCYLILGDTTPLSETLDNQSNSSQIRNICVFAPSF